MKTTIALFLATWMTATCLAADKPAAKASSLIAKGKYLVESSGQCQDCHTPRGEKGEFVREKWLQGAPLMFTPSVPVPGWTEKSTSIAGLRGWTRQEAVKFFMTGLTASGSPARPPMPGYRFSRADAEAITAYLMSLKATGAKE